MTDPTIDRERYLHMASSLGMAAFALESIRDGIGPPPQTIARKALELIFQSFPDLVRKEPPDETG